MRAIFSVSPMTVSLKKVYSMLMENLILEEESKEANKK